MMTIKLNKSWHFWLANFGDKRIYAECTTNICEYTRAVLIGTFWASVSLFFACIFGGWIVASLINIVQWVFMGVEIEKYTIMFIGVVLLFSGAIAVFTFKEWLANRPKKDTPPTFVGAAYRKFKDSTCFRVEFNQE